jgi:hypothetical protein
LPINLRTQTDLKIARILEIARIIFGGGGCRTLSMLQIAQKPKWGSPKLKHK